MDKRKKGCGTGVVGVCQWVGVPGGMAPSVQILYLFHNKHFFDPTVGEKLQT